MWDFREEDSVLYFSTKFKCNHPVEPVSVQITHLDKTRRRHIVPIHSPASVISFILISDKAERNPDYTEDR